MSWFKKISESGMDPNVVNLAGIMYKMLREIQTEFDNLYITKSLNYGKFNSSKEIATDRIRKVIQNYSELHNLLWTPEQLNKVTQGVFEVNGFDFDKILNGINDGIHGNLNL